MVRMFKRRPRFCVQINACRNGCLLVLVVYFFVKGLFVEQSAEFPQIPPTNPTQRLTPTRDTPRSLSHSDIFHSLSRSVGAPAALLLLARVLAVVVTLANHTLVITSFLAFANKHCISSTGRGFMGSTDEGIEFTAGSAFTAQIPNNYVYLQVLRLAEKLHNIF